MTRTLKISYLSAILIVISQTIFAQIQYKLDAGNSSMVIKGTSTLHDWEMQVEDIKSTFSLQPDDIFQGKLVSGDLLVNVGSIKSEHSLMDKKTYEALKKKSHPQIEVKLIKAEQNKDSGKVQMQLTIAGKTKTIDEDVRLADLGNGKVEVKGILNMKMSDYGVDPPVALMGTIKTGDEIKVEYNLLFNKQGQFFGEMEKVKK